MQLIRLCRAALLLVITSVSLLVGVTITPAHAADETCVVPQREADDTIHIQGCLRDSRETPPAPVEGVEVTVTDEAGTPIGTATTDATGIFDIDLGAAIDVLGNTYSVKITEDTLPEGTELRNPEQLDLKVTPKIQTDVFVTFPIGDAPEGTSKFTQGLQLAVGGLVFALLLAMASLGLSMIFGTTGLTNFAHGELITFGALVAFSIDALSGDLTIGGKNLTLVIAIIVATIASVIFGWLQDKVLWKPLRRKGVGLIAAMIVSIGFSIFLRNLFQYFWGGDTHNYTQWTNPDPWHIGQIAITPKEVGVAILATLILVAVSLAVQRTRIGKATRAVADNPALAASSGINVDGVISVVWAIGAGLAGLSGVLLGMTQGFDFQLGYKMLLLVFAAVVLGGLGSIWGAIVGSFVIGLFIEVSTLVIPAELKFVGALMVLIVVLMVRPQGLLGRAERVG